MISIISPAKSLDFESPVSLSAATKPQFIEKTEELLKIIQQLSVEQLQQIMNISNKIAILNYHRFLNFADLPSRQAIFTYDGDLYRKIDKQAITASQVDFLQTHILIISGLYGALKPLDYIKPYRLEMSVQLPKINLYDFWRPIITDYINQSLKQHRSQYLINLSSVEYASAIDKHSFNYPMFNIHFKEYNNGKLRVIGLNAKRARGLMTDFIIKNSIDIPDILQTFTADGYRFNLLESSEYDWVFIRRALANSSNSL